METNSTPLGAGRGGWSEEAAWLTTIGLGGGMEGEGGQLGAVFFEGMQQLSTFLEQNRRENSTTNSDMA